METSIERMLQYCSGIADEFDARLNRIRAFVPDHNPTAGAANEIILRDFLTRLSSDRYKVGQGFICDPAASDSVSKQCDILIYDHHNYPLVYSEGGVDVVFPHAVKMLIEVKTGLGKGKLKDALENICIAKQMNYTINGVVFAFQSPRPDTVVKNLQQYQQGFSLRHAPIAILQLDKGVIIHRWPGTELGGGENSYEVRLSKNRKRGVVIAFLLLLFFDAQLSGVWGGASIHNLMQRMLADNTEPIMEKVVVGTVQD